MLKYIPNVLTIFRLVLIPIILFFIYTGNFLLAFILFTISGITDVLDGFIARKFDLISNVGKLLDPLADKLTQISILAALVKLEAIPGWILIILVLKELVMVLGASFLYGKDVVVYSKWYGKLSTCLIYLAIVISLIIEQFKLSGLWIHIDLGIYVIALICTMFSLFMYIKCLYQGGFINKKDLDAERKLVVVKNNKLIKRENKEKKKLKY